jgi:3-hydroxyisobutyrate dehydrogenase-like beta-hydroxyacid dehydrogenase
MGTTMAEKLAQRGPQEEKLAQREPQAEKLAQREPLAMLLAAETQAMREATVVVRKVVRKVAIPEILMGLQG